jgi:thiol-disulfide isomerase/thioredoxin
MLRSAASLLCFSFFALSAQAIDVGQTAPPFSVASHDGETRVTRENLRGKVVLVDFWASWCGPCRESMPLYDKLRAEFPTDRFDVLAINLDEEYSDAQAFLAKNKVSYPVALDPLGTTAQSFGLVGMPSSFLLDEKGVIRQRHTGFKAKDIDELRKQIQQLLGETNAH